MKTEIGKGLSITGIVFYILTGYGFLRVLAEATQLLGASREQYMLAVGASVLGGLLLVYLPLCVFAVKGGSVSLALCEAGEMNRTDWIVGFVFLAALIFLRVWQMPSSLSDGIEQYVWWNLALQGIGLIFVWKGYRRMENRLTAVGAALAVLFMPSFANSVYTKEPQSLGLALFGIATAICSMGGFRKWGLSLCYAMFVCALGAGLADESRYAILHSPTLVEYVVLLAFYLMSVIGLMAGRKDGKKSESMIGIPFLVLFVFGGFLKVPMQEQGIFHVLLGAAAGGNAAHILYEKGGRMAAERSRDMQNGVEVTKDAATVPFDAERKKPKPGEYLDNPLPVPKRHVKKEMEYGFEPDPDKLFFDIPVSDEDDFDLQ